jgi:hypothetical protein
VNKKIEKGKIACDSKANHLKFNHCNKYLKSFNVAWVPHYPCAQFRIEIEATASYDFSVDWRGSGTSIRDPYIKI